MFPEASLKALVVDDLSPGAGAPGDNWTHYLILSHFENR